LGISNDYFNPFVFIKLGFPYFREARFVPLVTYNNYTAIRFKLEAAKIQTL